MNDPLTLALGKLNFLVKHESSTRNTPVITEEDARIILAQIDKLTKTAANQLHPFQDRFRNIAAAIHGWGKPGETES